MLYIKVLIALLCCSLLFAATFLFFAYIAFALFFSHISLPFGDGRPFLLYEKVFFGLCIAGIAASFIIHPYGAHLLGDHIRQLTSSALLQIVIFVFFASFQFIMLGAAVGAFAAKNHFDKQNRLNHIRAQKEVVAILDNAKVEVIARDAKVISDDGKNVVAEVTLHIKNVPFSIPYYELNIHGVGDNDLFFIGFFRETNRSIRNPHLKVTNRNGYWLFYDTTTKQEISNNAGNVLLRFEFSRVKAARDEMPKTITPRLGIWARDDKVYYETYLFFHKPIPVSFLKSYAYLSSQ